MSGDAQRYQREPGETGYYWVRWRRPYARRWCYDVLWIADAPWKSGRQVRSFRGWEPIDAWPNATFCGPIEAPEPIIRPRVPASPRRFADRQRPTPKGVTS